MIDSNPSKNESLQSAPSKVREILPWGTDGSRCYVPEAYAWELWNEIERLDGLWRTEKARADLNFDENERLRAALERITTFKEGEICQRIAAEALGLVLETPLLSPPRCSQQAQLSRNVGMERCVGEIGHGGPHVFNNDSYMEAKRASDALRGESETLPKPNNWGAPCGDMDTTDGNPHG